MGDGPSVLVTLRLSARDRALLEQLVERERRELEALGVEVSLSSVMRKLIRAAAKASAIDVAGDALPRRPAPAPALPPSTTPAPSQDQVRALLRKKMAERRGLGAELARKLLNWADSQISTVLGTLGLSSAEINAILGVLPALCAATTATDFL